MQKQNAPNERRIDTTQRGRHDGAQRLPHERDEAPDAQPGAPRADMQQAASDLEQGLVDTDLHGERGIETVNPAPPRQARPLAPAAPAASAKPKP